MEDFTDPLILQSLEGAEAARLLTIATFALLIYEWVITLDSEANSVFLERRLVKVADALFGKSVYDADHYFISVVLQVSCYDILSPFLMTPFSRLSNNDSYNRIQAILVLRVYYLFSNSKLVQNIVIACFIVSVSISLAFACTASINLRPLETLVAFGIRGCRAERPQGFWRLYLPPLVLHTLLYMFTVLRAVSNRQMLKKSPVMQRILKDGGFFYLITFVSVGFTAIGAFMEKSPHLNIPAIFSNFVLGITSVCVSRIMLSIQSLAAKLGSDTAWLLNNVELSRVRWRHGAHEGELIVDLEPAYEEEQDNQQDIEYNRRMYASDVELADIKSAKKSTGPQPHITVRTTRVGTFTDMNSDKYYSQSVLTMKS
ncbi:hypothetical protein EYR38_000169 [Pleurotus pulmonarius]|nr:hypothetical protein EYR38_000169 [Pleurotus pulmonarius]